MDNHPVDESSLGYNWINEIYGVKVPARIVRVIRREYETRGVQRLTKPFKSPGILFRDIFS